MFTFGISGGTDGFDPLVLLLIALLIEAYIGEARALFKVVPHPIVVIGNAIGWFDRKLNREQRSNVDRAIRGALVVAILVCLAGAIGWGVSWLTQNHDFGWVVELFGLIALLAGRNLYDSVAKVAHALNQDLPQGREAVSHIVGRDPNMLDEAGVARAAIETAAENFCDGVVAPVFWFVLFGFPGILIYKTVNTMDSMIGYTTPKYRAFGMTAARLDDVLNLIPARLAGLFISIAALFVPTAHPGDAFKIMLRDSSKHKSMNAGWPEGAAAGALGLKLAGPRKYREMTTDDDWIGDGTSDAGVLDIQRMLYLYLVASLINGVWVASLSVIRLGS
ncbi:MAG: cobalamin biosynthesis protein CobD [Alphaproteobacteria bacterium]|jgi:adenosylcobinamide-phosphate synthase|nr:cobalamin biosynthesis protein CobD [Alphaproteobacteria bacterium]MBT4219538.1 cobalamin biosynthesis protein CobD [Rhodospirillaceae bacterium]MBT4463145.1 cobalamin biosynthesis protein CobD [Rhodospirillaceae bacterium]MBT7356327.1 cobalamin biosynthesis protein CobD [Rhodospirillaceae bacterium]